MLFWIFMFIPPVAAIIVSGIFGGNAAERVDKGVATLAFSAFIFWTVVITTWIEHAADVSVVQEQKRVIQVYTDKRDRLVNVLDTLNYPANTALLNADSPIKSIVEQIGSSENQLASAEESLTRAYKSIAATRLGPMSGVITFVGGLP